MAGKKTSSTRKPGRQQEQSGGRRQKFQQQGEPEEFQNQQGEIREQDYADEMTEIHKQERGARE